MEKLIVFMMLLPFSLILLFQPALDRLEEGREKVVQVAIQRGVERAAIDGYFTDDIKNDMYAVLSAVGYQEEDIEFKGTERPTYRGDYIEGTLKVPNKYQFLMFENLFEGRTTDNYHIHTATRMSEFIN